MSGKEYATPVVAKLTTGGVIIPLPYGTETDWCKNVSAASGCRLTLDGQEYSLTSPEIISASVAEPLVPPANAAVWRRMGIAHYLSMKRAVTITEERVAACPGSGGGPAESVVAKP